MTRFATRATLAATLLAGACRPAPATPPSEPAPPHVAAAPPLEPESPPPTAAAPPEPIDRLEACADGDDEVCIAIHVEQPPITTPELAVQVVDELMRGDWNTAVTPEQRAVLEQACRTGDGAACGFVGHQTRLGLGVTTDRAAALRWFRRACAQRYWFACNELTMAGDVLGEKVSRRMFEVGCDKGDAASCFWAAARYQLGMGGPADEERATALYVRACDGDYGSACYKLSLRETDPARRAELVRRGCDGGSSDACAELRAAKKREPKKR